GFHPPRLAGLVEQSAEQSCEILGASAQLIRSSPDVIDRVQPVETGSVGKQAVIAGEGRVGEEGNLRGKHVPGLAHDGPDRKSVVEGKARPKRRPAVLPRVRGAPAAG